MRREDGTGCSTAASRSKISGGLFDLDELPGEADNTFETLGGFVMARLGHIPAVADSGEVDFALRVFAYLRVFALQRIPQKR